jgi:hypothetical protein
MIKIIEGLLGGPAKRAAQHAVFQKTPGNLLDQPDAEDVINADTFDPLEVVDIGFEDRPEAFKFAQSPTGGRFTIFAGCAQSQEELDDLMVEKSVQSGFEEFFAQTAAMALALVPRIEVGIRSLPDRFGRRQGLPFPVVRGGIVIEQPSIHGFFPDI